MAKHGKVVKPGQEPAKANRVYYPEEPIDVELRKYLKIINDRLIERKAKHKHVSPYTKGRYVYEPSEGYEPEK